MDGEKFPRQQCNHTAPHPIVRLAAEHGQLVRRTENHREPMHSPSWLLLRSPAAVQRTTEYQLQGATALVEWPGTDSVCPRASSSAPSPWYTAWYSPLRASIPDHRKIAEPEP